MLFVAPMRAVYIKFLKMQELWGLIKQSQIKELQQRVQVPAKVPIVPYHTGR